MLKIFACRVVGALALTLSAGALAGPVQFQVTDQLGQPLANAVVTLQGPAQGADQPGTASMDQVRQQFAPQVLAVRTGTRVTFPNRDNIRHQVYSFSAPKRFELRLYEGTPTEPELFDKPGVVVLGCNIHDWMLGYIYVTNDPWFAVSDANGRVDFSRLPNGQFTTTFWHPRSADMQPMAGEPLSVSDAAQQRQVKLTVSQAPAEGVAEPAHSAFSAAFDEAASETAK
ncbi:methylamine utilization protein [Pseudomonas sp. nanlin1]|uniref:methylamine utilization protein n=1 Tax=Pseudomonas sp. nanlin1 TaxID=3040605 RepID=UPI00388D7D5F